MTFSLGTDTAGSGRVPAALNNIVGLKAMDTSRWGICVGCLWMFMDALMDGDCSVGNGFSYFASQFPFYISIVSKYIIIIYI